MAYRWCLWVCVWVLTPVTSYAAGGTDNCRVLKSPAERLACYDRLYPPVEQTDDRRQEEPIRPPAIEPIAVVSKPGPAPTAPAARTAAATAAASIAKPIAKETETNFGYPERREKKAAKLKQITAEVIQVDRKWPDDRYVYDLDNGQRWEQTRAQRTTIRAGDRVTIRKGRLGGHQIANERGASTRVKRVGDG